MLKANQADVKLSDLTLTLQNGLTAVPLITRYSKSNILRTIHAITVLLQYGNTANVGAAYCMYDNSSQ